VPDVRAETLFALPHKHLCGAVDQEPKVAALDGDPDGAITRAAQCVSNRLGALAALDEAYGRV
jgi:hypothetical protein